MNNQNEPLIGAEVYLEDNKNIETKTDQKGFFKSTYGFKKKYQVIASFMGYQSDTIQVIPKSANKIKFILKPNENILKGVVVTAQKRLQSIEKVPASLTAIDARFLIVKELPSSINCLSMCPVYRFSCKALTIRGL